MAAHSEATMATICTIEKSGNPIAVVSMFENLLMPGALALALREGKWLRSTLTGKPALWDGKSPVTARASTMIELGLYESNIQEAATHGIVDKDHHIAVLNVEEAGEIP
jgi:hypothetical protein